MNINDKNTFTIAFLTMVILIDFMGMATVVVLFPKLLLGTSGIFPPAWSNELRIMIMGLFLAIYPLGQFIGASALGKLSDYHGRRKMLLITLCGTFIGFSLSGIAVQVKSALMLFLSRLLSGLCAGNVAIAQAGLLDVSTPDTKAKNISYGQIAMGSAYIVGPILGGWLSDSSLVSWFSISTPFWLFSLFLMVLFALTAIFYTETNLYPKKEKINLLNGLKSINAAMKSATLRPIFFVWLTFVSGWWLFESFMPAFLMKSFNYSTIQIGNVLAFNGALYVGFQYVVVQRLAKKMQAENMVKYFAFIAGVSIMSISFVSNALQLYMAMSIFVMSMGFVIPGIITCISNSSNTQDQGHVMGMVNSIQAISTVIVMLAGGYLNSINNNISIVGGGILVIISWIYFISITRDARITQNKVLEI